MTSSPQKLTVFKFEIYMYVFFKCFLQKYVLIFNLRGSSLRNSLLITDVTKGINLTTLWPTASLFCHINKIHERIIDLTHQLCSFYCPCYTTLFKNINYIKNLELFSFMYKYIYKEI